MAKAKKNPKRKKAVKPWLPSILVDLADVLSIDLEDGQRLKFPRAGRFALCANRAGTEIWIFTRVHGRRVRGVDDKAHALFEKFTGFEHDEDAGLQIQVSAKKMVRLGRAMNIVYRSDKFSRPGKTTDYIHSFTKMPNVSVDDPNSPSIVALRGGRIKIKQEGITG